MKLQNILRTQVIVIGFGAVLLLANAAPAQEIDNTVWNDNNTTVVATSAQPAAEASAEDRGSVATDSGALNLSALSTTAILTREPSVPDWTPTKNWIVPSLLVSIVLVVLYGLAIARRASKNLNARSGQVSHRAALS